MFHIVHCYYHHHHHHHHHSSGSYHLEVHCAKTRRPSNDCTTFCTPWFVATTSTNHTTISSMLRVGDVHGPTIAILNAQKSVIPTVVPIYLSTPTRKKITTRQNKRIATGVVRKNQNKHNLSDAPQTPHRSTSTYPLASTILL